MGAEQGIPGVLLSACGAGKPRMAYLLSPPDLDTNSCLDNDAQMAQVALIFDC
jgi:hypothetical protein